METGKPETKSYASIANKPPPSHTDESYEAKLRAIRSRILKAEREKKKQKKQSQNTRNYNNHSHGNSRYNKNRNGKGSNRRNTKNDNRGAYKRNMNVHLIETAEQCDIVMAKLKYTECVGFDCEGIITLGRQGKLSLIQICDESHIYLFDILKMDYKIPESLKEWMSSERCTKFIHDSRQDQDALFHCHDVVLKGIFDTTIADLIKRVWLTKANRCDRLKGMDSLSHSIIHNAKEYKVMFSIQHRKCGNYITLNHLIEEREKEKNKDEENKEKEDEEINENDNDDEDKSDEPKWKKIKVNCFDQKQNTKAMMRTDAYLWAKRPIPINLVIYAAVDGYVSLLMGQYFRRKFKQWMIDKTMFISAKWCRMVARQPRIRPSSSRVAGSIVKLVRSDTSQMRLENLPPIDQKFVYQREREAAKLKEKEEEEKKSKEEEDRLKEIEENTNNDIKFDNLLLMTPGHEFIGRKLKKYMNDGSIKTHEEGIMEYMTDIYKLDYSVDDPDMYVRIGKLNYSRLVPLTLLDKEKNELLNLEPL